MGADPSMLAEPLRSAAAGLVAASGGRVGYRSTFRTREEQINLRKDHCGTSEYAIFEMPASQCTPDTARPGSSQHELGLAVDFKGDLALVAQLAPQFGLVKTVPSEDWHYEHKDALSRSPRAAALRSAIASGDLAKWSRLAGTGSGWFSSLAGAVAGEEAIPELAVNFVGVREPTEILTDPSTWLRVSEVVGGIILAALGLYLVIGDLSGR